MAKASTLFRPVFVSFRPIPAIKRMARAIFQAMPLGAWCLVGSIVFGMLVAGCTATVISRDLHADILFGPSRRSRTLTDSDKFYGTFWLGLIGSLVLAAVTSYCCDKLRWAALVPVAYLVGFLLIALWWFGGF